MDYYTKFSLQVPIQNEEERTFWREMIESPSKSEVYKTAVRETLAEEVDEDDESHYFEMELVDDGKGVWIHDNGQSQIDAACHVLCAFLKKFRPNDYMFVSFASTGSKPAVGTYGGGIVFVSADGIEGWEADGWRDHMREEHMKDRADGEEVPVEE